MYAVRGRPFGEKAIKDGAGQVDIDWRGKRVKKGVILWHVGTNRAKDLLHSRLAIESPGPDTFTCPRTCPTSGFASSLAKCGLLARRLRVFARFGRRFASGWKPGTALCMRFGSRSILA